MTKRHECQKLALMSLFVARKINFDGYQTTEISGGIVRGYNFWPLNLVKVEGYRNLPSKSADYRGTLFRSRLEVIHADRMTTKSTQARIQSL